MNDTIDTPKSGTARITTQHGTAAASLLDSRRLPLTLHPSRLQAIDQLRAVAIISMMIAHFGPGVLERTPELRFIVNEILFLGKFATIAFIFTSGILFAFVYLPSFLSSRRQCLSRIRARAALVTLCALLICIPNYINVYFKPELGFTDLLFSTYSILNFYVLAMALGPLWLTLIHKNPSRNAVLLGAAHWILGFLLLRIWPATDSLGLIEYIRQNLISGPYAYFQLEGSALMVVPVGLGLRRAVLMGQHWDFIYALFPVAVGLTIVGAALGYCAGELDLSIIVSGMLKSPPRIWYWMFSSGPALASLLGLVVLEKTSEDARRALYPLSLFGQGALPIYTASAFLLPALRISDRVVVLEGLARILLPLVDRL
jgi:hypothetical protein